MANPEIAQTLDGPLATVKIRLHTAFRTLTRQTNRKKRESVRYSSTFSTAANTSSTSWAVKQIGSS